ncbi:MAG: hypothetical protein QM802_20965 [Agriterribacter sp.]
MKKMQTYGIAVTAFIMMVATIPQISKAQNPVADNISYQTFYDNLSPYGAWIDYPSYGHVWHPAIAGDFHPYLTNGYWDYSDEGWLWVSNYDWGWAPFHYGRWIYDNTYGWLWIPGYEWSPAWVTWGSFDNYYAWAPLMPDVYVGMQFKSWRPAAVYWNVCGRDHIYDRDIYNRVENRQAVINNVTRINIINNFGTTGLHNQYYSKGPDVKEVEKFTNRTIDRASIKEVNSSTIAGRKGNSLQVYRPVVENPQPREFKRVDNADINPVRRDDEKINEDREQQRMNIDHLPARRAPENIFSRPAMPARRGRG